MRSDRFVTMTRRALAALAPVALAALAASCSPGSNPVAPQLPPLDSIRIAIHVDTLAVGTNVQLVATAYDTNGVAVSGARFAWTSKTPAVCTVNGTGLVASVGEGTSLVIASAGGKADTARITVYTQHGWYAQTSNTARNLNGVAFASDGRTGVAVGASGAIVYTADAGATWTGASSPNAFDLYAAWFSGGSTVWAVGNNGVVLTSANGGASWTAVSGTGTSASLRGVCFANANYGWAVGGSGTILRTRDGGMTWSRQNPTSDQFNAVAFSDTSNGWAVAQTGQIWGTHDAGGSWYPVSPALTGNALFGVWRLSNKVAWAVGVAGTAAYTSATTDSLAWTLAALGAANNLKAVHFTDASTGYAVGSNGTGLVLKTLDGGSTWNVQASNSTQALNAVWFVDALHGWAVGDAGRIVHTSLGGNQ